MSQTVRQTNASGVVKTSSTGIIKNWDHACVFVTSSGQSNCSGFGDSALSVPCPNGYEIHTNNSVESTITDPVGQNAGSFWAANTGSLYPALAQKFYELTGRKAIVLSLGVGSSGLHVDPYSAGIWKVSSHDLYDEAKGEIDGAISYLAGQAYDFDYAIHIWFQGETDALAHVSQADYVTDFTAYKNQMFSDYTEWPNLKIFVAHIKNHDAYDAAMRAAAEAVAASSGGRVIIGSSNPGPYNELTEHYDQEELDEVGENLAVSAVNNL